MTTHLRPAGEWYPAFLTMLANSGNVRLACSAAGITRRAAYFARERDPDFRARWDDAVEEACDMLAAHAWAHALSGDKDLLKWLLAAHRREIYGNQARVDVNVTLRERAEKMAKDMGVPMDDLVRMAEDIAAGRL